MSVAIAQSVGIGGKNQPTDERAIEDLVRKAGIPFVSPRTLGGDIYEFQRLCMLNPMDGRIDANGGTLRLLNAVANAPKLLIKDPISIGEGPGKSFVSSRTIRNGGYEISYQTDDGKLHDTPIPAPYRLLLGPDQLSTVDVSRRPRKDLLDVPGLAQLLGIIDKSGAWGKTIGLRLFVTMEGRLISTSAPATLRCPVKPHNGRMLSASENGDLFYEGVLSDAGNSFYGRMFETVPGFTGYLFCWAGRFELDPAKRGFDCITYAGTTCGAKHTAMGGSGAGLAEALGATTVVYKNAPLDKAKIETLQGFFADTPTGYYLLYSSGHVTLAVDQTVYEFKPGQPGNKGFVITDIPTWMKNHRNGWTLASLKAKPPLANA